ncbi:hypothetical protein SAMN03159496_05623 [Rhizobium sp. NFR07]|uniref:hypothetical protein n=1 Tax=Rhizobium sp. NFR07 TaxID=1566262 RepID=UPI0008F3DE1B|nr:hypothetical protein [Rhizobium sp. NFR07]SFB60034.1 hypothetical protein SAMN03159496_05623 [Rhizobium sp. NFR07]
MSDESRTAQPEAYILDEHYCQHHGCKKWGCYGFEESRTVTFWYCAQHQPISYRGSARHGAARLEAAEIADMLG